MQASVSRVRVRPAPETLAIRAAGRTGLVVGETRPSYSGEHVVGPAPDDLAIAVLFDDGGDTLWFRPELLDVIGDAKVELSFGTPSPAPPTADRRPAWLRWLVRLVSFDP